MKPLCWRLLRRMSRSCSSRSCSLLNCGACRGGARVGKATRLSGIDTLESRLTIPLFDWIVSWYFLLVEGRSWSTRPRRRDSSSSSSSSRQSIRRVRRCRREAQSILLRCFPSAIRIPSGFRPLVKLQALTRQEGQLRVVVICERRRSRFLRYWILLSWML